MTDLLGGTLFARIAVEHAFVAALLRGLWQRLGEEQLLTRRSGAFWTAAEDKDFAAAAGTAEAEFRGHALEPESGRWPAAPLHADVVLRGATLWLETAGGGRLLLATGEQDGPRRWRVTFSDAAVDLLRIRGSMGPDYVLRFRSVAGMMRALRDIGAAHLSLPS